jgi:hypothetical protein
MNKTLLLNSFLRIIPHRALSLVKILVKDINLLMKIYKLLMNNQKRTFLIVHQLSLVRILNVHQLRVPTGIFYQLYYSLKATGVLKNWIINIGLNPLLNYRQIVI